MQATRGAGRIQDAPTKTACTSGMLLCLDREQRLVYIFGEILGVPDVVGGELLEISRDAFRKKLSRARRDLHSFMHGNCGLINPDNPCRCRRKTAGFIKAGFVDSRELRFVRGRTLQVKEVAQTTLDTLHELDVAYGDLYRAHPFYESPDFIAGIRALLDRRDVKSHLELS